MSRLPPGSLSALALLAPFSASACRADDGAYSFGDAQRFLGRFCVHCHGQEKPREKLNLKRFAAAEQVLAERKVWDEVLSRVRAGEMPPSDGEQVAPEEARPAFLRWAQHALRGGAADGTSRPGPAPAAP
jgi:hypothetical protein